MHYVEKRSHSSRIQGCQKYPPIQTERESLILWQSSGHLFIVNFWEDTCKSPTEPISTLYSQGFYQKADVDSGRTGEQLTWSSQQNSFKRNARNKMWTSTWPLSTLPKHLTDSREGLWKTMAKVWLSCQVHSNGTAVPRWYACKGPKWWRVFRSVPCDKWRMKAVQHDVFCHDHRCFPGWWQRFTY